MGKGLAMWNRREWMGTALAGMTPLWTMGAQSATPVEEDYYKIVAFEPPTGVVLESGAFDLVDENTLMVSSRRGEIWAISNPYAKDPLKESKWTRFAHGLHEVLGLAHRDGWVYCVQRGELTRMKDTNGDGKADVFETVNMGWEISGDYHEYAFGSKFDKEGNLWIVLCLTGSFSSESKFRGWCVRVTPEGKMIPTCSGIRSPGSIGFNIDGDVFYTDNQGPWNGTCSLKHLVPGSFQGHPDGNVWYEKAPESQVMGKRPETPKSGSRMMVEAARIPELIPPAVYFPYNKMGQSASGLDFDRSAGKFGPFAGQMFVCDQTHSTLMRVVMEKVNGRYQGACIPFKKGFGSGNVPVLFSDKGAAFVGGTNRGWGSRGPKPFAVERLDWTGKVPFEVHEIHAKSDGFELTFTEPVDPKTAGDIASYKASTFCYIYQASYGSPEVDHTKLTVVGAKVADDGKSVRITLDKLVAGHLHEIHLDGVRSQKGLPILHPEFYYTMNYIPKA